MLLQFLVPIQKAGQNNSPETNVTRLASEYWNEHLTRTTTNAVVVVVGPYTILAHFNHYDEQRLCKLILST